MGIYDNLPSREHRGKAQHGKIQLMSPCFSGSGKNVKFSKPLWFFAGGSTGELKIQKKKKEGL